MQVEGFQRRLKSLEGAEEQAQALQAQVLKERQALQECQLALQQEQERARNTATAGELQVVISNLQEERKSSQAKLAVQAEREERIATAVSDANVAAAKVKVRALAPAGCRCSVLFCSKVSAHHVRMSPVLQLVAGKAGFW